MQIHKFPNVLETYFVDEAKTIPTASWGKITEGDGYLGPRIKRLTGAGIMAGWALPVTCPDGNIMSISVALQYMRDTTPLSRWVMVVSPEVAAEIQAGLWNYLYSAMAWEVGFVGAVVAGYSRDTDEIRDKLGKEFSVYGHGSTLVPASMEVGGDVGAPVTINNVVIRTGDLIVGDGDGVIAIPKEQVTDVIHRAQASIVHEANFMAHVREGMGAVDVLELRDELKGIVEIAE